MTVDADCVSRRRQHPRRERAARAVAVSLLAALGASLVACVPTRPNDLPLQLSVSGGDVVFRWRGEPTRTFHFLSISYRWQGPKGEADALVATGSVALQPGAVFGPQQPPADTNVETSGAIPLDERPVFVFVRTGQSATELDELRSIYTISSLASLSEGEWVDQSGNRAATCTP